MTAGAYFKKKGHYQYLKVLDHCKWLPEIMMVPLKYMAASAPFKNKLP